MIIPIPHHFFDVQLSLIKDLFSQVGVMWPFTQINKRISFRVMIYKDTSYVHL